MTAQTQTAMLEAIARHFEDELGVEFQIDAVEIRAVEAPPVAHDAYRAVYRYAAGQRPALMLAAPYSVPGAADPVVVRAHLEETL